MDHRTPREGWFGLAPCDPDSACYAPGLSWHPFGDLGAARFFDVMPQILHLRCREEAVLIKAPKRCVVHLALRWSGHTPPLLYRGVKTTIKANARFTFVARPGAAGV